MEISHQHSTIVLGKDDKLDVVVYLDSGEDEYLQPVRLTVYAPSSDGRDLTQTLLVLHTDDHDGTEYLLKPDGIEERPML